MDTILLTPAMCFGNGAKLGSPTSMGAYAQCLMYGEGGIKADSKAAYQWWTKAAEKGDLNSMRSVGSCLYRGIGCSPNVTAAMSWFKKSAALGHTDSMVWVGAALSEQIVPDDSCSDTEERQEKALRWFEKAADAGDPEGMYRLGLCLLRGEGCFEDLSQARDWLRRSSAKGFDAATATLEKIGDNPPLPAYSMGEKTTQGRNEAAVQLGYAPGTLDP